MNLPEQVPPFILASGSPRRRELLTEAGFIFDVKKLTIDEIINPELKPLEVVNDLARQKLRANSDLLEENLVLTADTIVYKNNRVLGKPESRTEAIDMLNLLNNTAHFVTTSVCLGYKHKLRQFDITTKVNFRALNSSEIAYYIDNYQPFDKAGGYGIQEWIGQVGIVSIEGSYTNVVGLPVAETYQALLDVCEEWQISNP